MKPLAAILLLSFIICCKHPKKGTFNYKELHYDTNTIAFFTWDSTQRIFPAYSEPLRLQQEDIDLVDSLLQDNIRAFNKNSNQIFYQDSSNKGKFNYYIITLSFYKRQYFPYGDNNFQRVVHILCIADHPGNWKTAIYKSRRHEGLSTLYITINLSDKKVTEFGSGDFG